MLVYPQKQGKRTYNDETMATTMGLCEVFVQVPQRLRHLRARLVIVLVWDSLTLLIIEHVPPKRYVVGNWGWLANAGTAIMSGEPCGS